MLGCFLRFQLLLTGFVTCRVSNGLAFVFFRVLDVVMGINERHLLIEIVGGGRYMVCVIILCYCFTARILCTLYP